MNNILAVTAAAVGISFALPAYATGELDSLITPSDKMRLEKYEETRKAALAQSIKGDEGDLAELNAVITRPAVAFTGQGFEGEWKCRVLKIGGDLGALVVYSWFKCRVTDDGSGLLLEKLTGSQRTKGRIFDDGEKRAIYIGAGFVNNEEAPAYGRGPQTDQAGYAFRTGPDDWRIEFPAPYFELKLDILELKR